MQDLPAPDDLLAAVAEFLREQALPQLDGRSAFHARVAANVVDVVRRQLALAPQSDAAELRSLRALLGCDGSLEALNRELCRRIASGQLGVHTPALLDHLWQVTRAKLAVDQPRYATFARTLGTPPAEA